MKLFDWLRGGPRRYVDALYRDFKQSYPASQALRAGFEHGDEVERTELLEAVESYVRLSEPDPDPIVGLALAWLADPRPPPVEWYEALARSAPASVRRQLLMRYLKAATGKHQQSALKLMVETRPPAFELHEAKDVVFPALLPLVTIPEWRRQLVQAAEDATGPHPLAAHVELLIADLDAGHADVATALAAIGGANAEAALKRGLSSESAAVQLACAELLLSRFPDQCRPILAASRVAPAGGEAAGPRPSEGA